MTGRSSIPIFAPLPLDRDTRRIADLDPCCARPRSIGTIDPLRDDALGAQLACMLEYGRTIPGNMFVEKDVGLDAAQQARQGGLTVEERKVTQVLAIMLDQIEGIEDCRIRPHVDAVRRSAMGRHCSLWHNRSAFSLLLL